MNCLHHNGQNISMICLAPHQCKYKRKLCVECYFDDEIDRSQMMLIKNFRDQAKNKMNEQELNNLSKIITMRDSFKSMMSRTQEIMKFFLGQVTEVIDSIQERILSQNILYKNLVGEDSILAQSNYEDLEILVQIVGGGKLDNWTAQKDSFCVNLGKIQKNLEQGINIFQENFKNQYEELSKIKLDQQEKYPSEWKYDLYEVLAKVKVIDEQIYSVIIKMLGKEQKTDSIEFLQACCEEKFNQQCFRDDELASLGHSKNLNNTFKQIANILKNIHFLDFNKKNYYQETCIEQRNILMNKISKEKNILQFLKFLVHLTSLDDQFIQCGSNSLSLLVEMKVDLKNQSFQGIKIKNTSLIGANFFRCNFSKSEFNTVFINGLNLNGALLFNCKWINLTIQEQDKLDGNSSAVGSVCFSPDGTILATRGRDYAISLWDVKTGQEKANLDGHNSQVRSLCFSPDGTILASGSDDMSIQLWDVKTGLGKAKFVGHKSTVLSLCFSPDGTILASGSDDKSVRLWDTKTGLGKSIVDLFNKVISICFSTNGTILATFCGDKAINLLDTISEGEEWQNELNCLNSIHLQSFYSDDHTTIDYTYKDSQINFWEVRSGKKIVFQKINDILKQFQTKNLKSQKFEAQGALILKGEFRDFQDKDLRTFFQIKGSCILETQIQHEQQ